MERGFIKINGKPYVVDLANYHMRDMSDFSPRVAVPEGPMYSELGLYQPMPMVDWSGGFGFPWQGIKQGVYLETAGEIDTRHAGVAIRYTKFTTCDTTQEQRDGFVTFGGDLYSWGSSGVSKYVDSDATFSEVGVLSSGHTVNYLWHNGTYIFAALDDANLYYAASDAASSADWTKTGADSDDSIDYKWLHHHSGYLYAGKDISSSGDIGNEIYYADDLDLGDLYGISSADTDHIIAGLPGLGTIKAISKAENLLVFRPDGVYKIRPDRSGADPVLDYKDVVDTDNFAGCALWNEYVVYSIRDEIFQWNGYAISNITPPRLGDTWPYKSYGTFDNFVSVGKWLYMTAETNETYSDLDLLCYDGVGWHKLCTIYDANSTNNGSAECYAMHYDPSHDYLWLCYKSSEYVTGYIPCSTRSSLPYSDFTTDGNHYIETSKLHAGFGRIDKSTPSVLVRGSNLSSDHYIELYYKRDVDTSWKAWGADSGVTNVLTSDGQKDFKDPLGTGETTLSYKYMQYRIYLRTESSDQTPILEEFIPRVLMRPETLWGWDVMIAASRHIEHGMTMDDRTPYEIQQDLIEARNSIEPVTYEDIYGAEWRVNLTAVTGQALEFHGDEGAHPNIEMIYRINMTQLG